MPINSQCPGCGKTISAPDYAAGHKARCPHCRTTMVIPGQVAVPAHEVQVHDAAASAAEAMAMEVRRKAAAASAGAAQASAGGAFAATATPASSEPVSPVSFTLSPSPTPSADRSAGSRLGSRSGARSSTTIERMIAKTSPYGSLRTLASAVLGIGVLLAVLICFGGIAAMLVLAVQDHMMLGVGIFAGALVVSALLGLGAKVGHDAIRLLADLGDRSRHTSAMLEDLLNRPRDESF